MSGGLMFKGAVINRVEIDALAGYIEALEKLLPKGEGE